MVKALVAREAGVPPEVEDIDLPPVSPGDVRVRIAAAGVCHSDLSMVNGTIQPRYPVVLGHEASGVVVETGSAVSDVEPGTPVILNWAAPCRRCWFCLRREPWLCRVVEGVVSTDRGATAGDEKVGAALGVGAFAEETVVPRSAVVPLPGGIGLDVGAVVGCAVLTGIGATHHTADVRPGDAVLVIGLGGVGLSAVAGARLAGAHPVIAVDLNPDKEAVAREMGATDFLVWEDKLPRAVRGLTDGIGADHALECVGKPATIRGAWASTRRGGTCTVVGVGRTTDEVTFNAMELYHFGRNLTSSVFGSCDPERDIPTIAGHITSGALRLDTLITHRTDLHGIVEAFDRMARGEGVRTLAELG